MNFIFFYVLLNYETFKENAPKIYKNLLQKIVTKILIHYYLYVFRVLKSLKKVLNLINS